jgi:2-aminoethylphosphonate-pyruvate transaminase
MIKTAVILAAGLGSRLGEKTKDLPKGLLTFAGIPLIQHSIEKLIEAGIRNILLGTGYLHEAYEKFAATYSQITCVSIPHYQTSGSMNTLYHLQKHIQGDFLLLESDLLYEKQALQTLLTHKKPDVILASGFTHSGDEVFIETDEHRHLINMSKTKAYLSSMYGELVGITKLSLSAYQKMCHYAANHLATQPKMEYEQALVAISQEIPLFVHKEEGLAWCEIDDDSHWNRAVKEIYPLIQSRDGENKPIKRNILLNPGPATTTDRVKYAQVVPDICPREVEFGQIMAYISTELTRFVADPKEYTTVLFGGSGTAAVEAILSSVIDEKAVLIIDNGAYGKRMSQIAEVYQLNTIIFSSPYDQPIPLTRLEETIKTHQKELGYVAVVHNETTTGLLNDIESIGSLCQKYNLQLIVDAISSYAALPIDMEKMNIHYLAASANKNLQGMPGVSFVIAQRSLLEKTKSMKPRNYYLHLYSQYAYFEKNQQMRFTPPVQTLYALKQAILETKEEGITARYERYSKSWETLIAGITRLGLSHLVDANHHSRIITAILEPDVPGYDFNKMHDFFYERGFTIYPGKLAGLHTFRVANIGDITYKEIEQFLALLESYLGPLLKKVK